MGNLHVRIWRGPRGGNDPGHSTTARTPSGSGKMDHVTPDPAPRTPESPRFSPLNPDGNGPEDPMRYDDFRDCFERVLSDAGLVPPRIFRTETIDTATTDRSYEIVVGHERLHAGPGAVRAEGLVRIPGQAVPHGRTAAKPAFVTCLTSLMSCFTPALAPAGTCLTGPGIETEAFLSLPDPVAPLVVNAARFPLGRDLFKPSRVDKRVVRPEGGIENKTRFEGFESASNESSPPLGSTWLEERLALPSAANWGVGAKRKAAQNNASTGAKNREASFARRFVRQFAREPALREPGRRRRASSGRRRGAWGGMLPRGWRG